MSTNIEGITLHEMFVALLRRAADEGKIVTICQRSLPPLAMGHYYTELHIRDSRPGHFFSLIHVASDNDTPEFRQEVLPL